MALKRIAVVAGGLSLERDVSLRSGRRVADALADRGYDVTRLDLDDRLVATLVDAEIDLAYLTLHGKAGEDGTVQGLLDLLGIPYTGPDAVASALAWDKVVAKGLFGRAGIATPEAVAVSADAVRDLGAAQALERVADRLGSRLVVKPAQGGAAMGVRLVAEPAALPAALLSSLRYDDVVLVERFVVGTEVAVSIVAGEPLLPVEIVPKAGSYDFSARYTPGATAFFAPARLSDAVLAACVAAATAAWDVIGCRHVARADFIVDGEGRPWLLELDTCPGMTETSLLPLAAAAQGWSFPELCERVVTASLGLSETSPAVLQ